MTNPVLPPRPSTFHVRNFGCQMNVYDGERMSELLASRGMEPAAAATADIVILNTCHIREKAAEKIYSDIGRLRRDDGSRPVTVVAGCVAQAEGAEIGRRARSVDVIVGPQAYHRLPDLIDTARSGGGRAIDTDMPAIAKFTALPPRSARSGPTAFLTVQEGCDKFCTYCVVPYTRGAEVSRPWRDLLDEAERLVAGGAREITLLGQNVNAWSGEDARGRRQGLDGLIAALAELPDLKRIRYTTSHPGDMTEGLIAAHADVPKLMPYLHLPVQSGSDRILKAMNRSHDAESYLGIIARVRSARPDIALSGDFIVGFPGETEEDFLATLEIVRTVAYAHAFSFKYSPRPGTPAAVMADQVAPHVMDERLQRLQAVLVEQQQQFNAAFTGRETQILLERPGRHPGQMIGKSPWLQSVHVDAGDSGIGAIIDVRIASAGSNSLAGEMLVGQAA